jgi:PAS domain S-box-containing protein
MPARPAELVAALERLPLPVFTVRIDGTITWLNNAARAFVGDVVGARYTSIVAPESQRVVQDIFARRVHGDTSAFEYEAVLLGADGTRGLVEISTVPLQDEQHMINGIFGVFVPEEELPPLRTVGPELTPRQLEVLRCLAMGLSTDQIAERMGIARDTVRNHVRDLLRRLGVHSRLEAVIAAHERGLV